MKYLQAFEQRRQRWVVIRILEMAFDRQGVIAGTFISKKCGETNRVIMKRYGRNQKDKS